jgi:subtilisin family serine protease
MNRLLTTLFIVLLCALLAAGGTDPNILPGVTVLKLKPELKPALRLSGNSTGIGEIDDLARRLGVTGIRPRFKTDPKHSSPTDLSLILRLDLPPGLDPIGAGNAFSRLGSVAWAEPIFIEEALDVPNDYYYPYMRYFDALQAEQAWTVHKGESGGETVIAIVDTGVNWKHPDMAENIWNNLGEDANGNGYTIYYTGSAWAYDPGDLDGIDGDANGKIDDLIGWDFWNDANGNQDYDPWDSGGHGTGVAGIANARTNNGGIGLASTAWNVKTMPISTSNDNSYIYAGYEGIIYAAEMGADVINCSWGGIYPSQANQAVIDYAWSLGVVIVAASGNSGNQIPLYPSSYRHVVTVGNVRNSGVHAGSTYGVQLDVCAPMDSIYTASGSGYAYVGGATSYCSPIASSLAALIRSQHPDWTNQQVADQIAGCCVDVNPYNTAAKQNLLGYGRLNAYNAVSGTCVPTPGLKLAVQEKGDPADTDGDLAVEPGEQFSFNFTLRNYAQQTSTAALSISLTCSNPVVTILNGSYSGAIGADDVLEVADAFLVEVSPTALSQYVTFYLNCSADVPVMVGSALRYDVLVNAPGIYIWEGYPNSRNLSGVYIRDQLSAQSYRCTYGKEYSLDSDNFPSSLLGFDAVFLSFGIVGGNCYRLFNNRMFDAVRQYLEAGGRLYIEGGDVIAWDIANYFPEVEPGLDGDDILYPLLGIAAADDGSASNTLGSLSGAAGWHTLGLLFTGSTQTYSRSMDFYLPDQNGVDAFSEDDYGTVAVQSLGSHGQRVFAMSYALRELVDGAAPNTRLELLNRILDFFLSPELELPGVLDLSVEATAGDSLLLDWDYPFAVDEFLIYGEDDPEGEFDAQEATTQATGLMLPLQQRRFFRVKAVRQFGL